MEFLSELYFPSQLINGCCVEAPRSPTSANTPRPQLISSENFPSNGLITGSSTSLTLNDYQQPNYALKMQSVEKSGQMKSCIRIRNEFNYSFSLISEAIDA